MSLEIWEEKNQPASKRFLKLMTAREYTELTGALHSYTRYTFGNIVTIPANDHDILLVSVDAKGNCEGNSAICRINESGLYLPERRREDLGLKLDSHGRVRVSLE